MPYLILKNELALLLNKDPVTYEHSLRVGMLALRVAARLNLDEEQERRLVIGCCLHDIGKLWIEDEILSKDSGLTAAEWEAMKQHPTRGAGHMEKFAAIERAVIDIIAYHHERWNGMGYPSGLRGRTIPELARICAIIDSFDCMMSDRPYRKGMSLSEAKSELLTHSDEQFDKMFVEALLSLPDEQLDMNGFDPEQALRELLRGGVKVSQADEQFVVFTIGRSLYGVPIREVSEIIRMRTVHWLPNTHKQLRGMIQLRDKIVPVISLRAILNEPDDEPDVKARIIVMNSAGHAIGVIVDEVNQVAILPQRNISPSPLLSMEWLKGMYHHQDSFIALLDFGALIDENEILPHARA